MEDFILQMQEVPALFAVIALTFGCIFGSLLNVIIHRIPIMMKREWALDCYDYLSSQDGTITADGKVGRIIFKQDGYPQTYNLFKPTSACPSCKTNIKPWHNIPVFSWLFLKGKCASCQLPIPIRYPLVEAITGILIGALALKFGLTFTFFSASLLVFGLICISLIDFDELLIPDSLVLPLIWIGLIINLNGTFVDIDHALLGAVFGYVALLFVHKFHYLFTGNEGLGRGDFKLVAMLGAWLGIGMLPYAVVIAGISGLIFLLASKLTNKADFSDRIPFGPHLAIAGICLLFLHQIITPIWS